MASVKICDVSKSFGNDAVIRALSLAIADGEFVVFVGPSGCGKSTLLRMVAGLEEIDSGTVAIDGQIVNAVAPAKRGVAMVFQTYALYPHMNVFNNMAFALKQAKLPRDEIRQRVMKAAEILDLTDFLDRKPVRSLAGSANVAIGRAIVRKPSVFLFDEPLSNLDAALRVQTRLEIARLHQHLGCTMIYVTHDQVEAMTLADKIVVLRDGQLNVGTPMTLYARPANVFVAGFIGSPKMNFFNPSLMLSQLRPEMFGGLDWRIGIRPEHIHLVENGTKTAEGYVIIVARLELVENLGEHALLHLVGDDGTAFIAKSPVLPDLKLGMRLTFSADRAAIHVFDSHTGCRLSPSDKAE